MRSKAPRAWFYLAAALTAVALLAASGCTTYDPMGEDPDPPTGTMITNPPDESSLSSTVINVRGRAEVGARVDIYVNGEHKGHDVSSPAEPPDGLQGRFTVDGVELGLEGDKRIGAVATDLYGNVARDTVWSNISLDLTPPPVAFVELIGAEWDTLEQHWSSGLPSLTLKGRTDETAIGARARYGINAFVADVFEQYPDPLGGPDSVRFEIEMTMPPVTPENPDTLVNYFLEAFDGADNASAYPFEIYWNTVGRESLLAYDDGDYGSVTNQTSGGAGMGLSVGFQAPTWANYVTEIHYFIRNDNITDPDDPYAPTTKAFTAYIWKPVFFGDSWAPTSEDPAGAAVNDGADSGSQYPEEEWLELRLPNAVNISSNETFPDKKFCAGLLFDYKNNPFIAYDVDNISYQSFRYDWTEWSVQNWNIMIRAVVSDIPTAGGAARTAVIAPVGSTISR